MKIFKVTSLDRPHLKTWVVSKNIRHVQERDSGDGAVMCFLGGATLEVRENAEDIVAMVES